MAGVLQHLRSSTLDKRPNPASMVDGQVAINYASGSPGMFFKDSNGDLVKVGPVHVGSTAPNVSPASGGTAGNSKGEQWLDTSGGTYVFKIWDGSAWRSEAGEFVNTTGDTMTGSLTMGASANIIFEGSVDDGFETTLTVVNPTADRTITLPNVTGTVVTTGDSGTVTSTMIADGTIANADVNASAAIAGTKIAPNFGSQTVQTTGIFSAAGGSASAPSIAFTGDTNTGIYSPGADQLALSTNGTGRLFVDASGRVGIGVASPQGRIHSVATSLAGASYRTGAPLILENDVNNELQILSGSTSYGQLRFGDGDSNYRGAITYDHSVDAFTMVTAGSERLRITSTGLVGIGTSAPGTLLHLSSATGSATPTPTELRIATTSNASDWSLTDPWGRISFYSADQSDSGPKISAAIDATAASATGGIANLSFNLAAATTGTLTSRLFISNTGNVGIGTTSPNSLLHVNGEARFGASEQLRLTAASTDAYIDAISSGGNLAFRTNGGAGAVERARIDSSGRLGIGTSSPSTRLEISEAGGPKLSLLNPGVRSWTIGLAGTASNADLLVKDETGSKDVLYLARNTGNVGIGTTSPGALLELSGTGQPQQIIRSTDNTSVSIRCINTSDSNVYFGSSGGDFRVQTNAQERFRVDSSGRLLVGTSSAQQVSSTGLAPYFQLNSSGSSVSSSTLGIFANSASNNGRLSLFRNRATTAGGFDYTGGTVQTDDVLGQIDFNGVDGQATPIMRGGAIISAVCESTPTAAEMPTRLVFSTTADGASSPTERLRITNDSVMCYDQAAPVSYAAAATLVVGDLKNGLIQYTGAAATLTLPTGTLTEGGFSGVYTNMAFEWSVINTGSGTCTIGAGTAHTIVGGATVAAGASGRFASRRTAANTFVSYRLS